MPTLRLDADAKAGVKAFDDLNKVIDKTEDKLELTTRQAKQLELQAKRIVESNLGPQERYNKKLEELAKHVKVGTLTLEQAGAQAQKYGQRLSEVGRAGEKAFDTGPMVQWAANLVGPMTVAQTLLGTLQKINTEQQSIADKQLASLPGRAKLAQLSGGNAGRAQNLGAIADWIYQQGFVTDDNQAAALTYELGSAGLEKDAAFFSRLALVDDAAVQAKSVGLIRQGFAGGDSTGTASQIVSKILAAASPATGVSGADIGTGVATAAAGSNTLGLRDEETLAAVSRLSQVTGSGAMAGTQLRALQNAFIKQGMADGELRGAGLESMIGRVKEMKLSQSQLAGFLGSTEASSAFGVLSDTEAFRARISEIESAQSSDMVNATINAAVQDRVTGAGIVRRRFAARREIAQQQQAINKNLAQADRDFMYVEDMGNFGEFRAGMNDFSRGWVDHFRGGATSQGGELALQALLEETRRSNDIAEQQLREQRNQNAGASTRPE